MFIPDPGSYFFPSRILDPNCLHPGSRILIKEFRYFNPKKSKKWFLSSKKYDPGCSSRIPDPDADFLPSRISDPGVKKAPNPGSRIRIRNTGIKLGNSVYPGSQIRLFSIPDPNCFYPVFRIRIKEFKYFNPIKMVSKL
jgi:hypothetical protein